MKNILVIDGAENCAYDIFAASEEDFKLIYPAEGQDIEFIDDFFNRVGENKATETCDRLWKNFVPKKSAVGIHGILFYQLNNKKEFYPNKRDSDLDGKGR